MNNNIIKNNIATLNISTPIKFTSENNKAKTVNAIKQENLIDRYVNSAQEASKASMVDNSILRAFGQKVKKMVNLINPKKLNTPEVIQEAKKVDMEITQYVQSGAYEKEFKHNSINYVA